ncbi:MAG: leucine-rich repeat domain-containing protein [Bacteroidales bacterium]|nr:leucine-rich repeat domain-containing protein [Bacteroidales bacterium]
MKKVLVLLCTILCANVLLAQTEFMVGELLYQVTNPNEVKVKDCLPIATSIIIPTTVSNSGTTYNVTSIGEDAFRGCSSLTSVSIGNGVTSIGEDAFWGCSSLTSVNIGNSVTYIGEYAFYNCSSLSSVSIPNSVTYIDDYAFYGCSSLTSFNIGNSVTYIGNYTFYGCSSLSSVNIPNSVTYIGWSAFNGCNSLTSVNIGNSVTRILAGTFDDCSSLTSVTIGNSITSIAMSAFSDCSGLTTLNFNAINCDDFDYNEYNYIPDWHPFYNCPISTITIGNSVERIPDYFAYNFLINSITIPNSVTSIGNSAFKNCSSLTSVTCLANIPPSLGYSIFYNTPSSKTLRVYCGLRNYYSMAWGDYFAYDHIYETPFAIDVNVNNEVGGNVGIVRNSCSSATFNATANNCYQFVSWNDGNTDNPRVVNVSSDTTFTAIFEELPNHNYNVNVSINNDAFGSVYIENDCNSSTITATANNCYQFVSWNDGNTENPRVVNVSSDTSLTANFEEINFNTEFTATICEGDTYTENNFNESEAGVYTQNLQTINGCDSVITLNLNVLPIFDTTINATICEGETYNENDFNVSEAGTYTQNFQTTNGCCIVTLTLNVNPSYNIVIDTVLNEGDVYTENGFNESEIGTYVQYFQTIEGCDSIITLNILSNVSLLEAEAESISFYPNPTNSEITFSQTIEKVEVIDLTGKAILTFTNAKTINIESLPAGAYYLRLTNNDKAIIQKVIKE